MADVSGASAPGADYIREKFGVDEAIAMSVLDVALSRGGDYAELYFEHKDAGSITYGDGRPHCWGPRGAELIQLFTDHIEKYAPQGADLTSWKY